MIDKERHRKFDTILALITILGIIFLILVFAYLNLCAAPKKGEDIDIYYKDKYVESWEYKKFETLIKLADNYNQEMLAESKGKVKIILQEDPWKLIQNKTYKTKAKIVWFEGEGKTYKEIKVITIDISLKDENNEDSFIKTIDRIYTAIAKPGCVIFFGLFLLFVFI